MTDAYLIAHPPRQRQFRERGTTPSGVIVIHTAENTPDWVGPDTGAEGVASFIQGRSDFGSYHLLVDSDSTVRLIPFHLQAYGDGTGSNPHAIHISAATQAAKWSKASPEWRLATARNMGKAAARAAKWLKRTHGVTVPARRITRAQSDARVPGFISHAERDPARRTDPGADFPWDVFLNAYQRAMRPKSAPKPGTTPSKKPVATPRWDAIWRNADAIVSNTGGKAKKRRAKLIRKLAAYHSAEH